MFLDEFLPYEEILFKQSLFLDIKQNCLLFINYFIRLMFKVNLM